MSFVYFPAIILLAVCTVLLYINRINIEYLKRGERMKDKIHPEYYRATARCACGNEFEVGSTKENIKTEICSKCHPFFTGNKNRLVDTTGRVDKFKKKYGLN